MLQCTVNVLIRLSLILLNLSNTNTLLQNSKKIVIIFNNYLNNSISYFTSLSLQSSSFLYYYYYYLFWIYNCPCAGIFSEDMFVFELLLQPQPLYQQQQHNIQIETLYSHIVLLIDFYRLCFEHNIIILHMWVRVFFCKQFVVNLFDGLLLLCIYLFFVGCWLLFGLLGVLIDEWKCVKSKAKRQKLD